MGKIDGMIYSGSIPEQLYSKEKESSFARELLKKGFWDFFHMEYKEEEIRKQKYGKPYDRRDEGLQFSISHCRGKAVAALSHQKVGIDVEGMRRVNVRTVRKCCSREEMDYVFDGWKEEKIKKDVLSEEETMRFLKLWTLKESYVKMTGEGLRMPFDKVCFRTEDFGEMREQNMYEIRGKTGDGSRHFLYLSKQFTIALTIQWMEDFGKPDFVWKEYSF